MSTAARIGTRRGCAPGQVWTTMRTATVTWALAGAVADRAPQPATAASTAVRTLAVALAVTLAVLGLVMAFYLGTTTRSHQVLPNTLNKEH